MAMTSILADPANAPLCPAAVADMFRLCDVDPTEVGGDWLDLLEMVGTLDDGSAASDPRR